jgi:SAM-dependent methyltransferase
MASRFPATIVTYHTADYTQPLDLPLLDGIVLANTIHFHAEAKRATVLQLMRRYLQPGGRLILVEYGTDRGNRWVPYPMSFPTWQVVAEQAGFTETTLLATRPSRFLGQIYAALSFK